jgi:hypothetical protein
MTEEKKENRGGKRIGAGPKFKYGEETSNVTLRVPTSKKEEVKRLVYAHLQQYVNHTSAKDVKGGHYGC